VIWVLAVGGVVLTFVVIACAAALVEVFKQLAELREALNLRDEPIPLGVKAGELRTDEIGLPGEIAAEPKAIVVFLSTRCATCLTVAEAFRGGSPATVWFVLPSLPTPSTLLDLLADSRMRVILDEGDEIANRVGVNVTPMVLTTSFGDVIRAQAVSSARQVLSMVPTVFARRSAPQASTPQQSLPSEQSA
jgi:hypothetical protein